eukprot:m.2928 g.2928  ORF g.2928 m.2928 type:complete len:57 (+) comp1892_c0_seq1:365-535(+)
MGWRGSCLVHVATDNNEACRFGHLYTSPQKWNVRNLLRNEGWSTYVKRPPQHLHGH